MVGPIWEPLERLHEGFNALFTREPALRAFWEVTGEELLSKCFTGVMLITSEDVVMRIEHAFLRQYLKESERDQAKVQAFLLFVTGSSSKQVLRYQCSHAVLVMFISCMFSGSSLAVSITCYNFSCAPYYTCVVLIQS